VTAWPARASRDPYEAGRSTLYLSPCARNVVNDVVEGDPAISRDRLVDVKSRSQRRDDDGILHFTQSSTSCSRRSLLLWTIWLTANGRRPSGIETPSQISASGIFYDVGNDRLPVVIVSHREEVGRLIGFK